MRLKIYYLIKNKEYAITGMTIKPELVDSELVKIINTKKLQRISQEIQEKVKNYKEPNLNLTISHPETKTCHTFYKENRNRMPSNKNDFFQYDK